MAAGERANKHRAGAAYKKHGRAQCPADSHEDRLSQHYILWAPDCQLPLSLSGEDNSAYSCASQHSPIISWKLPRFSIIPK